jgi:hypothetical protein
VANAARPTILWHPESSASLQAAYHSELRHKRAFVAGARGAAEREICALRLVHPESGATMDFEAEVVWVKAEEPGAGLGFALHGVTPAVLEALERFVNQPSPAEAAPPSESADEAAGAQNLYDRVRRLTVRERESMARHGALHERVALERVWGGAVWELLLQNPQLSAGELAQIAKNASLPASLVSVVVANAGWLAKSEVQRALLGNPRVSGVQLDRVLRALSKTELGRLAEQSGVRPQVKTAAKKLLGG